MKSVIKMRMGRERTQLEIGMVPICGRRYVVKYGVSAVRIRITQVRLSNCFKFYRTLCDVGTD